MNLGSLRDEFGMIWHQFRILLGSDGIRPTGGPIQKRIQIRIEIWDPMAPSRSNEKRAQMQIQIQILAPPGSRIPKRIQMRIRIEILIWDPWPPGPLMQKTRGSLGPPRPPPGGLRLAVLTPHWAPGVPAGWGTQGHGVFASVRAPAQKHNQTIKSENPKKNQKNNQNHQKTIKNHEKKQ